MIKRELYLDFDCTLVDSALRTEHEKIFARMHRISADEYMAAARNLHKRFGAASFTYTRLFNILAEKRPWLSRKFLADLNGLLRRDYLFPDTLDFVSRFRPEELIIITEGDEWFQSEKIKNNGLENRVGEIRIVRGLKGDAIVPKKSVLQLFLDDAPRHIDDVKRKHPSVFCIQMREPAPWEEQRESRLKDYHCRFLSEAAETIKSIEARFKTL